jgi:hypothetical protein
MSRIVRSAPWALLCAACLAGTLGACSDEDDRVGEREAQAGAADKGVYVVGGYLTSQDDWIGYLAVTSDISASGSIDLERVVEFPDDMSFASPGDGVVYVGNGGMPVIERWLLGDDHQLTQAGTVGLAQYGIATGLGSKDPLHFLAEDKAYFIDAKTLQVVVWNPRAMETLGSFSLEGFEEPEHFVGLNFVHRDGDRLLLSARYWRADDTAATLTRVAIIDTVSDTVSYIDDDRCGNVAFQAHDSHNNLYLASHPAQTAVIAVGAAGAPVAESCIIRVKSGASEFDADYYVGLDALVGGHAGGIMQGAGDEAFILKYQGPAFTLDNYAKAPVAASWEIQRLTLGDEEATVAPVEGVPLQSGYGLAFTTRVDDKAVPYVITVQGDFTEGVYYDVSRPGGFEKGLTVPGFPGKAILVR